MDVNFAKRNKGKLNLFGRAGALLMILNMSLLGMFFVFTQEANAFDVDPGGKIEIKKFARMAGDTKFFFESNIGNFSLMDGEDVVLHLGVGKYDFREIPAEGWYLDDLVCRGDRASRVDIDLSSGSVNIDLADKEFVKCFFYNELTAQPEPSSIKVEKYLDEDGLASTTNDRVLADSTEWMFYLEGDATTSAATVDGAANFSGLTAGSYIISEKLSAGYELVSPENNELIVQLAEGEQQTVEFVNYLPKQAEQGAITVRKYIDEDGLASTTADRALATSSDWTFLLFDGAATSTRTSIAGETTFTGLEAGEYRLSEVLASGYGLLEPLENNILIILGEGESFTADFVNYPVEEPVLGSITVRKYRDADGLASTTDDRTLVEGEWTFRMAGDATSTVTTSGGTAVFNSLQEGDYTISEVQQAGWQAVLPVSGSATISLAAGQDMVLDFVNYREAEPVNGGGSSSSGGGSSSSGGGSSFFTYQDQGSAAIPVSGSAPEEPVVAGEEGEPVLKISKQADRRSVDPGEEDVLYTVVVENQGDLTAFNVVIKDTLPQGLSFADREGNTREVSMGDLAPGQTRIRTFLVDVEEGTVPKKYINTAEASADNHAPVTATAEIEIKEVEVLAETGFGQEEVFSLLAAILILNGSAIFIGKKTKLIKD